MPAQGHQSDPGDWVPEGGWVEQYRWPIGISGKLPGNLQQQWLQTQGFPQTPQEPLLLRPGMGVHGAVGHGAGTSPRPL